MGDRQIHGVQNFQRGTVVHLYKKGKDGRLISAITFYDKNNNGKLDKADVYIAASKSKKCPKKSKFARSGGDFFCRRSVTARDIKVYGKAVSKQFAKAKRWRKQIAFQVKGKKIAGLRAAGLKVDRLIVDGKVTKVFVSMTRILGGLHGIKKILGLKDSKKLIDVGIPPSSKSMSSGRWIVYSFCDLR